MKREVAAEIVDSLKEAGVDFVAIADTVGYAVPQQFGEFIKTLRTRIPNSDKARWSVHCHNDLGMAVANSLAGVVIGGARQVECTINGLGERAGNTSLEEIVMAVDTTIGPEQNLLDPTPLSAHQIQLSTPILTNEELEKLRSLDTPKGRSGMAAW